MGFYTPFAEIFSRVGDPEAYSFTFFTVLYAP